MIKVFIDSIRVSLMSQLRVVILKDPDSGKYLPIFIGPCEAEAIAVKLQKMNVERPLTHDLLKSVIGELGARVTHILVSDLKDDTFYARIVLDVDGKRVEVDSRPSDAIALAVRVKVSIFVEEAVLEKAGITLQDEEGKTPEDEEKLSVFRDFINTLDLDDLGKSNPPGEQ